MVSNKRVADLMLVVAVGIIIALAVIFRTGEVLVMSHFSDTGESTCMLDLHLVFHCLEHWVMEHSICNSTTLFVENIPLVSSMIYTLDWPLHWCAATELRHLYILQLLPVFSLC